MTTTIMTPEGIGEVRGPALIGETPAVIVIIRRRDNPETFSGDGAFKWRVFAKDECEAYEPQPA